MAWHRGSTAPTWRAAACHVQLKRTTLLPPRAHRRQDFAPARQRRTRVASPQPHPSRASQCPTGALGWAKNSSPKVRAIGERVASRCAAFPGPWWWRGSCPAGTRDPPPSPPPPRPTHPHARASHLLTPHFPPCVETNLACRQAPTSSSAPVFASLVCRTMAATSSTRVCFLAHGVLLPPPRHARPAIAARFITIMRCAPRRLKFFFWWSH